jgi:hypothetical protein
MIKTDLPSYLDELKKLAKTTELLFTEIDQNEAEESTFIKVLDDSGLINKMPGNIAILRNNYENHLKSLPLKKKNLQKRLDRINALIEAIEKSDEEGKVVDAVVSMFSAAILGVADEKPTIEVDGEEIRDAKEI